jgi:mono/diheme cytochrome c family protein
MKTTLRTLLSAGAVMLVMSTGLWAADAAAGKALYATKCKTCHGADGTPPAAMAKAMGIKNMNDAAVQGKSDAQIKDAILKGVGKMKPVAGVSPADADNLVAAVRSMK